MSKIDIFQDNMIKAVQANDLKKAQEIYNTMLKTDLIDADFNHQQLLMIACTFANLDMVKYIEGLPQMCACYANSHAVICAAERGELDILKWLLSHPCVIKNKSTLFIAAYRAYGYGHINAVRLIMTIPHIEHIWCNVDLSKI